MIVAVLALALAPFGDQQVLGGQAFERFVRAADAICPERRARNITPADLDWYQENFVDGLAPRRRATVDAVNRAKTRCTGNGLSCPTTATLAAFAHEHLISGFAAFTCRAPPPPDRRVTGKRD